MKQFAAALLIASAQAILPHLDIGHGIAAHSARHLRDRRINTFVAPGKTVVANDSLSDFLSSSSDSDHLSSIEDEVASRLKGKGLPGVLGRRQQKAIAERVLIEELDSSDLEDILSN